MNESSKDIEIIPISKFQENFDDYMEKIEISKKSFIIETEDGSQAVMIPLDEEIIKIHMECNNDAS
jgi:PHD/YefM family antitoxin component YafN of YafNO toxin-antitoxin module